LDHDESKNGIGSLMSAMVQQIGDENEETKKAKKSPEEK
jgi:hypothetical protein